VSAASLPIALGLAVVAWPALAQDHIPAAPVETSEAATATAAIAPAPPLNEAPKPQTPGTDFPAREEAAVAKPGSWSVGLFNPLRIAVRKGMELELHPLLLAAAPHIGLRWAHVEPDGIGEVRVTGEYGLTLPTPAFRNAKPLGIRGDLVPSCKVAEHEGNATYDQWCSQLGWVVVPRVGVAISGGLTEADPHGGANALASAERATWTLRAGVTKGSVLAGEAMQSLDAWAPVNVAFAPLLGGLRIHLGAQWDHLVLPRMRLRGEANGYWLSPPDNGDISPWVGSAYLGCDFRTSAHTRITAGAFYWNSDMHEIAVSKGDDGFGVAERVRTHELWPTVDFVWGY
jgi:hypothetical protein